jgi:hypothetical protein
MNGKKLFIIRKHGNGNWFVDFSVLSMDEANITKLNEVYIEEREAEIAREVLLYKPPLGGFLSGRINQAAFTALIFSCQPHRIQFYPLQLGH